MGGSGGLPPEAEAFSEFLDVKLAISRLSSFTMFNITTPRRGGGQGACPLKLKHFLSFLMSDEQFQDFHPLPPTNISDIDQERKSAGTNSYFLPMRNEIRSR